MKWIKKGHIYGPSGRISWAKHSALTPTPVLINEDIIRVYAGFRDENGISRIGFVDVEAENPSKIRYISKSPVLDIGVAGAFDDNGVILGDTMGDLRKFYSLATLIFVGRSLVPMGGSDMMEAAAQGKCTIFGTGAFNFQQTVDALLEGNGAIMVKDGQDLLQTVKKCLTEPNYAKQIAENGQEVIKNNQGATGRTVEQILKLVTTS